jgi:hypothetical protein
VITLEKYGPNATIVTGELGRVDGTRSSSRSTSARTSTRPACSTTSRRPAPRCVTVYNAGFIVGERRGLTIQVLRELYAEYDQDAILANVAELAPTTDNASRVVVWDGDEILDLVLWDLRSVSTLTVDIDTATPTTLVEGTDFWLRPKPNRDGAYPYLKMSRTIPRRPRLSGGPEREVRITGNWGFSAIPERAEQAVKVAVSLWIKRDAAAFAATYNPDEGRALIPDYLPAASKAMVRNLKRRVAGV